MAAYMASDLMENARNHKDEMQCGHLILLQQSRTLQSNQHSQGEPPSLILPRVVSGSLRLGSG